MIDCAHCEKEGADFDCNGLKFCDEICGYKYLEPEIEITNVKMAKTLSDKIPNGTRGYIVGAVDGLNQVHFENDTIAFCYMAELEIVPD